MHLADLLSVLLPIIVAALTTVGFEYLQKGVTYIDGLPDTIKRVIVGIVSFGLTAAATALGVHLSSTDPTALQAGDLSALISAGLSYVFHLSNQAKATATAVNAPAVKAS